MASLLISLLHAMSQFTGPHFYSSVALVERRVILDLIVTDGLVLTDTKDSSLLPWCRHLCHSPTRGCLLVKPIAYLALTPTAFSFRSHSDSFTRT